MVLTISRGHGVGTPGTAICGGLCYMISNPNDPEPIPFTWWGSPLNIGGVDDLVDIISVTFSEEEEEGEVNGVQGEE